MSDELDNNKTSYQAQSSETMGGSGSASPDMDYVLSLIHISEPTRPY